MRRTVRRLAGLAAVVLASSLALAPAAWAQPDSPPPSGKNAGAGVAAQPLVGVIIGIDPGHNGGRAEDPSAANRLVPDGRGGNTACNTTGSADAEGYTEHEFAFSVAEQLGESLDRLGASVRMTRTEDGGVGPCVDRRGTFAEDNDVDLMLSIHAISGEHGEVPGFLAAIAAPPLSDSQAAPSRELAETMVEQLIDAGFESNEDLDDPIVLRPDDATLNFARRPAVLLELGDLRNADDAAVMRSEDGQLRYVEALTAGVVGWSHEHR